MFNEFIEQLIEVMGQIEYDLISSMFALVLLAASMVMNNIAGIILALIKVEFDWKKALSSIIKLLAVVVVVLGLCVVTDLVPVLLKRVGLTGEGAMLSTLITTLQIVAMIVVALIKYIKDIYDKLLILFNVKKEEVDELIQDSFEIPGEFEAAEEAQG